MQTKRLRVFGAWVEDGPGDGASLYLVLFAFGYERTGIIAQAVLVPHTSLAGATLLYCVEVTSQYRRQAYDTELLKGIREHMPELRDLVPPF